ncbi:hypothetical protein AB0J86_12120 [Micromonospora sp. NPDC049559]|uniref:hypothetical protein n=1 Tax=Micromonospora sp. NPDC049559 TaxID=3155923 RepID=UPI00341C00F7
MQLPDLTSYRLHRRCADAELDGIAVPGLRAEYYRRPEQGRLASVGRYWYGGREVLMAWGFVDEAHCRYCAVRAGDGGWHPPMTGCPTVRVLRDPTRPGEPVRGLAIKCPDGRWLTLPDPRWPGRVALTGSDLR